MLTPPLSGIPGRESQWQSIQQFITVQFEHRPSRGLRENVSDLNSSGNGQELQKFRLYLLADEVLFFVFVLFV